MTNDASETVEIELACDGNDPVGVARPERAACDRAAFALAGFLAVWAAWTLLDSVVDKYHPYLEVAALGCAGVLGVPWRACTRHVYSLARRKWSAISETL
jgi:hypothetical protein